MSKFLRVFLWCPAWRLVFALTAPIDNIAKCRMADALGFQVTWRHVLGLLPVNADSMTFEGCQRES